MDDPRRSRGVDATRFVATRPSAVQFAHSAAPDPPENLPGSHGVCVAAPSSGTWNPASALTQLDSPVAFTYVPTAQGSHVLAPLPE